MAEAHSMTFHVKGMHCKACTLLTEHEAKELPYITGAHSDLARHTIEVAGKFENRSRGEVADDLTRVFSRHGYAVSSEAYRHAARWGEFAFAAPIAIAFFIAFIVLQKIGIVDLVHSTSITYSTALAIGAVASLSTCMAVVGGLVLSMSATYAQRGARMWSQGLFHIGRLVSFFIFGGVIGAVGSAFALDGNATFVLSFLIGLIMLVLGANLLDVFPWMGKLVPAMPKFLSRRAFAASRPGHVLMPLLAGALTFFLPCGFTQSMQIFTLTTGSFLTGGLTMLSFALGTLPVLALVSFGSFSIMRSANAGVFFKAAGLVVIMFALLNLLNSFVAIGLMRPIFSF